MHILVPIFVCVVLPVAVVLIISLQKRNSDNKRAEILIKAIEANKEIDVDRLTEAMSRPKTGKSPREIRNRRLLFGCMFTLLGILFVGVGLLAWRNGLLFDNDNVMGPTMTGCVSLAVGISFLIVYYATRNRKDPENRD